MNKASAKKIATWIVVPLMAAIFILDIITVALCNKYCEKYSVTPESFTLENGDDRIHFLNTANSDAIIIESNGHFALVDAGEGNNNPRRKTEYKGYENEVVEYILKVCSDSNGIAHLDFILASHCHYDHIGGFKAVITNKNIIINKAYFKGCDPDYFNSYEKKWGLTDTYNEIIKNLNKRNVPIISNLPKEEFLFGDFIIELFNTENNKSLIGKGENSESVGVKLTKGNKSAFLAADITRTSGVEELIQDDLGKINLLKIGHHGYYGSSSMSFLRKIKPDLAIVTNQLGKVYPNVKWNLTMVARCPFFATFDNNGIIATFTDSGEILLTNHIH